MTHYGSVQPFAARRQLGFDPAALRWSLRSALRIGLAVGAALGLATQLLIP